MPNVPRIPVMKNDFGDWAQHYVSIPYDHYRLEIYYLFIEMLVHMKSHSRVLDVGAGPGNLTYEYFKLYPDSVSRFVLLDASRELLKVAKTRFQSLPGRVRTVVRSYNSNEWDKGLGNFDAIVSNNSLFHLLPQNLGRFYNGCYQHLKKNGILLNQQAFGYESQNNPSVVDTFSTFVQTLPRCILPQESKPTTHRALQRLNAKKMAAGKLRTAAMERARASGVEIAEATEHQYLTAETHLEQMRKAGFSAGIIWQKRDFAVLMGVKGEPLASNGTHPICFRPKNQ
jgi:2-polyprenyl-3-methyl-5-hydroxy-6-metoxy-1,4-benzoquinol methylase